MAPSTLLQLIGKIKPQAWDAIIPHGPLVARFAADLDRVMLNPQPLPPVERFEVAAAEMAHRVAQLAIEAEALGGSSARAVSTFVDDWCGTPWPRPWPWPWPGPRPDEDVAALLEEVQTARVIGAVVFASYGARLGAGDLQGVFAAGAEKLAEVAVAG